MITRRFTPSCVFCALLSVTSAAQTPLGGEFDYQGRLQQSGQPFSGTADLQFDLYDADIGGNLLGSQTIAGVTIANGLFTVKLNGGGEFGSSAFAGDRRWLRITVNGTPLAPRQELTATPFSQLSARLRLPYSGSVAHPGSAFEIVNAQDFTTAIHGSASGNFGFGLVGDAPNGAGVYGFGGNYGVFGESSNATGVGLFGYSIAGTAVYGYSSSGNGLEAYSNSGNAVRARRASPSGVNIAGFGTPAIFADSSSGNGIMGVVSTQAGAGLVGIGPNGYGLYATSANGYPVYAYDTPSGVNYAGFAKPAILGESLARNGVMGVAAAASTAGIVGYNPNGFGVFAQTASGTGLYSYAGSTGYAIRGVYNNVSGADMSIFAKPAILGESNLGNGVMGVVTSGGAGVVGFSPNAIGVYGFSNAHVALQGVTENGFGLYANATNNAIAIYGLSTATTGQRRTVLGRNNSNAGIGVHGWCPSASGTTYGVLGEAPSPAGWAVFASGDMGGSGLKAFEIDHPFDPENKTLRHFCAEGPEPQNIYNGIATTDHSGFATITLPDYFEEINRDFRYQLTVIDHGDDFILAKVVDEIQQNRFRIRTSRPNVRVSWEVKGIRNDRYVRARGFAVEADKDVAHRGTYLQPTLFDKPLLRGQFHIESIDEPKVPDSNLPNPPVTTGDRPASD